MLSRFESLRVGQEDIQTLVAHCVRKTPCCPLYLVRLRALARHKQGFRLVICWTLYSPVDACVRGLEFLRFESPLAIHIRTTVAEEAEKGMRARLVASAL
jgi:hypothetical protein